MRFGRGIQGGCGADLMSDVLAAVQPQALLLTGLCNPQVVRTAQMADVAAIVFVRGKIPAQDVIDLANEERIPLITTPYGTFELCAGACTGRSAQPGTTYRQRTGRVKQAAENKRWPQLRGRCRERTMSADQEPRRVITDADAHNISRVEELSYELKISDVMTRNIHTVTPDMQIVEVLESVPPRADLRRAGRGRRQADRHHQP